MHPFIVEASTQGNKLKDCLDYYNSAKGIDSLKELCDLFKNNSYKRIVFSGMGSSYYAPFSVVGYLTQNGIPSVVINAAELANNQLNLIEDDTLLILVSQSGESAEVVDVIEGVKGRAKIVAVVNNEESTLAKESDIQLYINAGYEEFISSKSYVNTVATLQILAATLVGKNDTEFKETMYDISKWIQEFLLVAQEKREEIRSFIGDSKTIDFIANGASASSAFQAGLIFREGPKYTTNATLCAEYSHGWNLFMEKDTVVVIFDPFMYKNSSEEAMREYVVENGGKVILITSEESGNNNGVLTIQHPKLAEELAPLVQIIPCTILMGWLLEEINDDN